MELNRISQAISIAFGTVSSLEENLFLSLKFEMLRLQCFNVLDMLERKMFFS